MSKIVFIAGNAHSGSTLLDLLLSAHPGICGLGEVTKVFKTFTDKMADYELCSCGEPVNKCPFWSKQLEFQIGADYSYPEKYRNILRIFNTYFPDSTFLVDSSKYLPSLKQLHEAIQNKRIFGRDLFVVHLIKDVRSYVVSMKQRRKTGNLILFKHYMHWYKNNRRIQRYLDDYKIDYMRIGYEELCFRTDVFLKTLCARLNIPFDDAMLDVRNSQAHIAVGNGMRSNSAQNRQIIYDDRWQRDRAVKIWFNILFFIRRYNWRTVYHNI